MRESVRMITGQERRLHMEFSDARWQIAQAGVSELAAGHVVQSAYDTGQPQKLAGRVVRYVHGYGFQVGKAGS